MITATEITYQTFGQIHVAYDRELKDVEVYKSEVIKTNELAQLISVEQKQIEPTLLLTFNFRKLKKWNSELQKRFDHIDKEAIL